MDRVSKYSRMYPEKTMTFFWFFYLPGGKIEHREPHRVALKRELTEELGVSADDIKIGKLLRVEEDFVEHIWEGQHKNEHIIAIVYAVTLADASLHLDFVESGGDAAKIPCFPLEKLADIAATPVLAKCISSLCKGKK